MQGYLMEQLIRLKFTLFQHAKTDTIAIFELNIISQVKYFWVTADSRYSFKIKTLIKTQHINNFHKLYQLHTQTVWPIL